MEDTSLQQLLNGNLTDSITSNIMNKIMMWLILPSIITIIIFVIIFVANTVRRHRVERAIFEIRDILRDMHMQQRQNDAPAPQPSLTNAIDLPGDTPQPPS